MTEAAPLLTSSQGTWSEAAFTLGPIVFALPFVLWRLCRGDTNERGGFIILGLALVFYIAARSIRFASCPYAEIVLVLIWTVIIVAFVQFIGRLGSVPCRVLVGGVGLVILLVGHIVVAVLIAPTDAELARTVDSADCDWRLAGGFLRDTGADGTLLTYIYPGAEVAWRTGYGVVAAPYHRMEHGIVDAHRAFLARPHDARKILTARNVGLVVLCNHPARQRRAQLVHRRRRAGQPLWASGCR